MAARRGAGAVARRGRREDFERDVPAKDVVERTGVMKAIAGLIGTVGRWERMISDEEVATEDSRGGKVSTSPAICMANLFDLDNLYLAKYSLKK